MLKSLGWRNALILFLCIACLSVGGFFYCTGNTSIGYRDVQIQKFSHKYTWLWFRNWEGEGALNSMGGLHESKTGQATNSGGAWCWTVIDPDIIEEIQKIKGNQLVRIHYDEKRFVLPWNGSTYYRVTKVEVLD